MYTLFQLWVGPGSKAAEEKQFFDSHLAPFYRIEQVHLNQSFQIIVYNLSWCMGMQEDKQFKDYSNEIKLVCCSMGSRN